MGVINNFLDLFTRRQDASFIYDLEDYESTAERAYMKRLAIDEVINFVARAVGQTEFRIIKNDMPVKNEIYYHLNVRPNTDKSAGDFWQELIYKLLRNGEVLVIQSDSDDLLIADSFVRTEYALYPDKFSSVVVKEFEFERTFNMDDVLYLTYGNTRLDNYLTGLWSDYGELMGRMFDLQLRNNQIRANVKVNLTNGTQVEKQQELQKYIDNIYNSFEKKSVAVVPTTKGFEYEELGDNNAKNQSFDEINHVKDAFIDDVAGIIGVPTALIHGSNVESNENTMLFNKYCLSPLLKKIVDELNAKLFEKVNILSNGVHIEAVGLDQPSILDLSEQVDRLASSGVVKVNEVRQAMGLSPLQDGDRVIMTKNYTTDLKGGEQDD
ncbi:phage portal protein [Lactiplantibacillus plantarum]|uniref:phage portal protein n=1 Tax=Lactiplantibacillus plantarum TaxID=1590 RepID=UPI003965C856